MLKYVPSTDNKFFPVIFPNKLRNRLLKYHTEQNQGFGYGSGF